MRSTGVTDEIRQKLAYRNGKLERLEITDTALLKFKGGRISFVL